MCGELGHISTVCAKKCFNLPSINKEKKTEVKSNYIQDVFGNNETSGAEYTINNIREYSDKSVPVDSR